MLFRQVLKQAGADPSLKMKGQLPHVYEVRRTHAIFTGRAWPGKGEQVFVRYDHDAGMGGFAPGLPNHRLIAQHGFCSSPNHFDIIDLNRRFGLPMPPASKRMKASHNSDGDGAGADDGGAFAELPCATCDPLGAVHFEVHKEDDEEEKEEEEDEDGGEEDDEQDEEEEEGGARKPERIGRKGWQAKRELWRLSGVAGMATMSEWSLCVYARACLCTRTCFSLSPIISTVVSLRI